MGGGAHGYVFMKAQWVYSGFYEPWCSAAFNHI